MKNLTKILLLLIVIGSLTSCTPTIQVMDVDTGKVSTIRAYAYEPEVGDTIVTVSSNKSFHKTIYGKYVGKIPQGTTSSRKLGDGKEIITIVWYNKEVVLNRN